MSVTCSSCENDIPKTDIKVEEATDTLGFQFAELKSPSWVCPLCGCVHVNSDPLSEK